MDEISILFIYLFIYLFIFFFGGGLAETYEEVEVKGPAVTGEMANITTKAWKLS